MAVTKSSKNYNSFLDALHSEIVAGNENLSSWINHIHSKGAIERLFQLETWLKSALAFLNIDHLPLTDSEREDLLSRSFLSEIKIVRQALQLCEMHACALIKIGDADTFEFEKLIDKQIRRDRIPDTQISHVLEQMTPVDSVSKLLDSLNDIRISIDAFQRIPNPGYQLFLTLGRNYRQELKNCRYIDMLMRQRFRIQYDLIENRPLTELLRGIHDEQVRRDTALALLYLFRYLKYLKLVYTDLQQDRALRHNLAIFSLIHKEMEDLSNFLQTRFLKRMGPGKKLKNAAEMAAYSLKTESRKAVSRELVFLSRETDPSNIYTRMENSHGLLKNCCQMTILGLIHAIDENFNDASLFPKRVERIAGANDIRRELWELRKWLMNILENEPVPDTNLMMEHMSSFKDRSHQSLMYRDWVGFENFTETITVSNEPAEILAHTRTFVNFIEDLIQEVSKRGMYQQNINI